jgi:hypothetical protein
MREKKKKKEVGILRLIGSIISKREHSGILRKRIQSLKLLAILFFKPYSDRSNPRRLLF